MAAQAAVDKKASDVRILLMTPVTVMTDYFVICSGETLLQARAIADAVEEALEKRGVTPRHREHSPGSGWILLDYGSVVVHVFREEERQFYSLERLWGDAQSVEFTEPGGPADATALASAVDSGESKGHAGYFGEG